MDRENKTTELTGQHGDRMIFKPRGEYGRGSKQIIADLLLLFVAFIWGSTFVMVKRVVEGFPVFLFLGMRFFLAAITLAVFYFRRLRRTTWREIGAGGLIGIFLFAGYAFQTVGLRYTTAAKAGFITGLSVVLVPVFSAALLRRMPTKQAIVGVLLSTIGLALLSLNADLSISKGDLLVLCCAVSFALHIVTVSAFAPKADPIALTTVQVLVVALISITVAGALGEIKHSTISLSGEVWFAAAFTGVLATAVAFGIQNSAQRFTSPTHTALIFAAEPVFAGIFGVLWAGEQLIGRAIIGCVLILCGMIAGEIELTEKLAVLVSRILNPLYATVPVLILAAFRETANYLSSLLWAIFGVTTAAILPGFFLLSQLRRGNISDWHISNREERTKLPISALTLATTIIPTAILELLKGPKTLQALFVTGLFLALIMIPIIAFWKISQHACGIATITMMLVALLGPLATPVFLLVPLVGWARVRVGAHTIAQVTAGAILGFVISFAVAFSYGLF